MTHRAVMGWCGRSTATTTSASRPPIPWQGLQAGARQAEVTVNGIGERAGNASLEEVVMALATRRPELGLETGVDTREITRVSRMVSHCTGIEVPPTKAVVGRNAFAHEAGIHQDGMLKDERTYEIMTPESVGCDARHRLVLGKHSGRHAFRYGLKRWVSSSRRRGSTRLFATSSSWQTARRRSRRPISWP